jgi:hypothetical protein
VAFFEKIEITISYTTSFTKQDPMVVFMTSTRIFIMSVKRPKVKSNERWHVRNQELFIGRGIPQGGYLVNTFVSICCWSVDLMTHGPLLISKGLR